MKILSIGEILWDVFPDGERLGGAAFNFSAHAARLGHEVLFVSAVGRDARGEAALARAAELGVRTELLQVVDGAATGIVEVHVDTAGQPDYRLIRPAAYDAVQMGVRELELAARFAPDWIYYGTLHQIYSGPYETTRRILAAAPDARTFYDVNLRPDSFSRDLVLSLLSQANAVKLNEEEARVIAGWLGADRKTPPSFCGALANRFPVQAICVTRGERGCAVWTRESYAEVPGIAVTVVDTVGAGDAFAAAFLDAYQRGLTAAGIGSAANQAGARAAGRAGAV